MFETREEFTLSLFRDGAMIRSEKISLAHEELDWAHIKARVRRLLTWGAVVGADEVECTRIIYCCDDESAPDFYEEERAVIHLALEAFEDSFERTWGAR